MRFVYVDNFFRTIFSVKNGLDKQFFDIFYPQTIATKFTHNKSLTENSSSHIIMNGYYLLFGEIYSEVNVTVISLSSSNYAST